MIRLIAAIDQNRGIAKTGTSPWYIKDDLKHFKDLTTGGIVVMGHNTYKNIGKPLPNRRNIIVSRDKDLKIEGAEVIQDLGAFISQYHSSKPSHLSTAQRFGGDIWVIGGQEIFDQTINLADELYLTCIEHDFKCDKFFPEFENKFKLIENGECQKEGDLQFHFTKWQRK